MYGKMLPPVARVFISYNRADRPWAEWIAGVIEREGYQPIIQAWHFRPGEDFILRMQEAAADSDMTIAVLSEAYLKAEYTQPEWSAAVAKDPTGKKRKLIPVRVGSCSLTGMLAARIYIDLVGMVEQDAERTLIDGLKPSGKPNEPPPFPEKPSESGISYAPFPPKVEPSPLEKCRSHPELEQPKLTPISEVPRLSIIGQLVGNYKLQSLLGAGGFGEVYRAKHIRLGNEVAIKVSYSLPNLTPELERTFFRGMRGVAALNHPNIVKVHDFGPVNLLGEPRVFVVSDLVDGEPLAHAIGTHHSPDRIQHGIRLFWQICDGIAAAHETKYIDDVGFEVFGVLHGDIKPANILIDRLGNAKIIDFMLVDFNHLFCEGSSPASMYSPHKLRFATTLFGTVGYMAPEQETDGIVTRRTDIYALGALLYEICTGLRLSEMTAESFLAHLQMPNSPIPQWVLPVIEKCIARRSTERFGDVVEIATFARQPNIARQKQVLS